MICDKCGQRVVPIKTKSGEKINCEADPVYFRVNSKGKQLFFTLRGDVMQGDICAEVMATGYAYMSHFSICKARQRLKTIIESGEQMRMNV